MYVYIGIAAGNEASGRRELTHIRGAATNLSLNMERRRRVYRWPYWQSLRHLVSAAAALACLLSSGLTAAQSSTKKEHGYYLPPAMSGNLNPDSSRSFPASVPAGDLTGAYTPNAASLLNGQPITSPVPMLNLRGVPNAVGLPAPQGADLYHPILPQPSTYLPGLPAFTQGQATYAPIPGFTPIAQAPLPANSIAYGIQNSQPNFLEIFRNAAVKGQLKSERRNSAYGSKRPKRKVQDMHSHQH